MRNLKLRVSVLCIATVLTLGLAHTAAQACTKILTGGNAYGSYDCRFSTFCDGWCYYECTCGNLFPGYTCDDVLLEAGFILGDSPKCIN
ncbi:MAG TPA: hypothetical protein VFZ22_07825 [Pyrinomonadaceae bacterium]|nr:hypothetical protein [Pyrinomonadaceae bacterium]